MSETSPLNANPNMVTFDLGRSENFNSLIACLTHYDGIPSFIDLLMFVTSHSTFILLATSSTNCGYTGIQAPPTPIPALCIWQYGCEFAASLACQKSIPATSQNFASSLSSAILTSLYTPSNNFSASAVLILFKINTPFLKMSE